MSQFDQPLVLQATERVNEGDPESIRQLKRALQQFADDRNWGPYHTPKNLLMALTGEVGELVEIFQWLSVSEAEMVMDEPLKGEHVREEIADVFIYLVRLADLLGIDLIQAANDKIVKNARKYPAGK